MPAREMIGTPPPGATHYLPRSGLFYKMVKRPSGPVMFRYIDGEWTRVMKFNPRSILPIEKAG